MKGTSLISVVVPNFNQRRFLTETLESIFSQRDVTIEVIVIDGGSTDGSVDILRHYGDRLAYWSSERDRGHYDAVNKGMAKTTGEVMAFLNSDDKLFPGALRIVAEIFANHSTVDWITSLIPAAWDVDGNCFEVARIPGFSKSAFLDGCYGGVTNAPWFIQQESTFWRRSLWERSGSLIRTELTHAGDFDLWSRFFEHADLVGVNALLGGFRIRECQRLYQGTLYPDQCKEVLHYYRATSHWTPNYIRTAGRRCGFFGIKKLGDLLRYFVGYQGKRIVRQNPGKASAWWELQEYRFP